MAHKNSRGDKDSKGCEIGADTPHARRKKGFCKYVITDEFGATRFAYEGALAFGSEPTRFRAVSIESKRGELKA